MLKTYQQRFSRLVKIKNDADTEIARIKELRKTMVQKNLEGVYSDEVFKEQNTILEDKMLQAQIVKDEATMDRYNIDAVTDFIKTLLADLGETYKRSNLSQIKVLLGSIFPTGVAWNYDGTLNRSISPIYQAIRTFSNDSLGPSAEDVSRTHIACSSDRCLDHLGYLSKNVNTKADTNSSTLDLLYKYYQL